MRCASDFHVDFSQASSDRGRGEGNQTYDWQSKQKQKQKLASSASRVRWPGLTSIDEEGASLSARGVGTLHIPIAS